MNTTCFDYFDSPVGALLLISDGEALIGLHFAGSESSDPVPNARRDPARFVAVREQLTDYFAGRLQVFDLPLDAHGTPFQKRVWNELRRLPFGETISYGELARRIGQRGASRAVGRANGQNPIAIIVPCHRVIGSNGNLTGFGGGMDRKRWLLDHEARASVGQVSNLPRQLSLSLR